MKTLYVDGRTPLHRLAAGPKLAGLLAAGILLFLTRSPLALGPALALATLAYASLGQPAATALRRVRPLFVSILLLTLVNWIIQSPEVALVSFLRLSALVLLAAAITGSTPVGAIMGAIETAARPLERLGLLRAADLGLAAGLTLRFLPEIISRHEAIRDAHRARGLSFRLHRALVPLIILTLKDADSIAAAIDARGIRGH